MKKNHRCPDVPVGAVVQCRHWSLGPQQCHGWEPSPTADGTRDAELKTSPHSIGPTSLLLTLSGRSWVIN